MEDATRVIDRVKELLPLAREVDIVEYFEGGWSNRNYRIRVDGEDAVLRIKNPISGVSDLEETYLSANPLAPTLWAYDKTNGDMITAFVDGEMLVNSPIEPAEATTYLLELHQHIPSGLRTYDPANAIKKYLEGLQMAKPLQAIYADLNWQPERTQGCHNELNDWNVLKTPTGFCTLDWESAGDNDPLFDLIGLCYGLEYDDEKLAECIARFDASVDPDHIRRTRILYLFREHAWALDRIRHGSEHAGIFKQKIDTTREIIRLAEGFYG